MGPIGPEPGFSGPEPVKPRFSTGATLAILVVLLIAGSSAAALMAASLNHGPGASPSQLAVGPTSGETPSIAPVSSSGPSQPAGAASTQPTPTHRPHGSPSPAPTLGPTGQVAMPFVPVVSFWSTDTAISLADLKGALSGASSTYSSVVVPTGDGQAIAGALGITLGSGVQSASPAQIAVAVRNGALGVLRAGDVGPNVRALGIGDVSLFGENRLKDLSQWPLTAMLNAPLGQAWDGSHLWTMLAGGDMFMDRGIYREVVQQKKGVDFPFDGGTAVVTGHHCCGQYVTTYEIPDVKLTGNAGAVRALVQNADLAVANLETPVPDNWVYHAHDYIFSSNPALLPMFTDAGIDFVTIANNHIKDFGSAGIASSRRNLAAAGLKFAGAGMNLAQAGAPTYLQANGTKVGIVACEGVSSAYYATPTKAGALPCNVPDVVRSIKIARKNADLVIVFAHWGVEYDNNPLSSMPGLAQAWIKAGAGLILGAHTHVPGAIDQIDGKVVFFSLGNFIFDQTFRTATMESALPEMTFNGDQLVQITLHPFVAPDSQPNLLNPATDDGAAVMDTIRRASQNVGLKW